MFLGREIVTPARVAALPAPERDEGAGYRSTVRTRRPYRRSRRAPGQPLGRPAPGGGDRRALNLDARLIIMDEPTAALAVAETRKVLSLARRLAGRGCAVVFISHYLVDVFEVADRLVVFRRGRKIAERRREATTFRTDRRPDYGRSSRCTGARNPGLTPRSPARRAPLQGGRLMLKHIGSLLAGSAILALGSVVICSRSVLTMSHAWAVLCCWQGGQPRRRLLRSAPIYARIQPPVFSLHFSLKQGEPETGSHSAASTTSHCLDSGYFGGLVVKPAISAG